MWVDATIAVGAAAHGASNDITQITPVRWYPYCHFGAREEFNDTNGSISEQSGVQSSYFMHALNTGVKIQSYHVIPRVRIVALEPTLQIFAGVSATFRHENRLLYGSTNLWRKHRGTANHSMVKQKLIQPMLCACVALYSFGSDYGQFSSTSSSWEGGQVGSNWKNCIDKIALLASALDEGCSLQRKSLSHLVDEFALPTARSAESDSAWLAAQISDFQNHTRKHNLNHKSAGLTDAKATMHGEVRKEKQQFIDTFALIPLLWGGSIHSNESNKDMESMEKPKDVPRSYTCCGSQQSTVIDPAVKTEQTFSRVYEFPDFCLAQLAGSTSIHAITSPFTRTTSLLHERRHELILDRGGIFDEDVCTILSTTKDPIEEHFDCEHNSLSDIHHVSHEDLRSLGSFVGSFHEGREHDGSPLDDIFNDPSSLGSARLSPRVDTGHSDTSASWTMSTRSPTSKHSGMRVRSFRSRRVMPKPTTESASMMPMAAQEVAGESTRAILTQNSGLVAPIRGDFVEALPLFHSRSTPSVTILGNRIRSMNGSMKASSARLPHGPNETIDPIDEVINTSESNQHDDRIPIHAASSIPSSTEAHLRYQHELACRLADTALHRTRAWITQIISQHMFLALCEDTFAHAKRKGWTTNYRCPYDVPQSFLCSASSCFQELVENDDVEVQFSRTRQLLRLIGLLLKAERRSTSTGGKIALDGPEQVIFDDPNLAKSPALYLKPSKYLQTIVNKCLAPILEHTCRLTTTVGAAMAERATNALLLALLCFLRDPVRAGELVLSSMPNAEQKRMLHSLKTLSKRPRISTSGLVQLHADMLYLRLWFALRCPVKLCESANMLKPKTFEAPKSSLALLKFVSDLSSQTPMGDHIIHANKQFIRRFPVRESFRHRDNELSQRLTDWFDTKNNSDTPGSARRPDVCFPVSSDISDVDPCAASVDSGTQKGTFESYFCLLARIDAFKAVYADSFVYLEKLLAVKPSSTDTSKRTENGSQRVNQRHQRRSRPLKSNANVSLNSDEDEDDDAATNSELDTRQTAKRAMNLVLGAPREWKNKIFEST